MKISAINSLKIDDYIMHSQFGLCRITNFIPQTKNRQFELCLNPLESFAVKFLYLRSGGNYNCFTEINAGKIKALSVSPQIPLFVDPSSGRPFKVCRWTDPGIMPERKKFACEVLGTFLFEIQAHSYIKEMEKRS